MIEFLGNSRRRMISPANMNKRERDSKIFRSNYNKLRLKLKEKWLFIERSMRILNKLKKTSLTDWRMKLKSSKKRMSN
jgi:hypothetical protein